nr:DUF3445 domain-containing protein [Sneathiella limimaris]
MGLKPLQDDSWIEVDENYTTETAQRRELLTKQREKVFASTPEAKTAEQEVLRRVLAKLKKDHPNIDTAHHLNDPNPLARAAALVQEDLVIMQEKENGFALTAAAVCFPSAWDLASKVGRTMRQIHDPVPRVNTEIGRSIDLFFNNMKSSKNVQRFNWGLYDSDALFQPSWWRTQQAAPEITQETVGSKIFFRVEKQTLQRLENGRDTLFTIRIFNTPLEEVAIDPNKAAQLSKAIQTMPEDFKGYKSINKYQHLLIPYLEAQAL